MSDLIRVHVYVKDNELTADTLEAVYGMTEIIDLPIIGVISGMVTKEALDALMVLRVSLSITEDESSPVRSIIKPIEGEERGPVTLMERLSSWLGSRRD